MTKATATKAKTRSIDIVLTAGGEDTMTEEASIILVLIPVCSAVLGHDSKSEYKYVALFHMAHLFWDCHLIGPGMVAP